MQRDCPKRPADKLPVRPPSEEKLGFERKPMVAWLDPRQLARTGIRVSLSLVFGEFIDKRELQATLPLEHEFEDYSQEEQLWFDYVADLGDGFDATYTIAYLLGRPSLPLPPIGDLPRGRVLVMGGDQVYPTASREEYRNRLLGPYEAALPCSEPATAPHLFAIPGNHDWYDGLTNFLRIFCQDGWIGGWATRQQRSYFALQLPHRWWLWGIDIQFDVYIDQPQIEYFCKAAKSLKEGDQVILVTGKSSWKSGTSVPNLSYDNLTFLEERIIEPTGAKLAVAISGDDHYYAHFAQLPAEDGPAIPEERRLRKITSGGGGAFTSATHHLKETIELKRRDEDRTIKYDLVTAYPKPDVSERLRFRAPDRLFRRNGSFLLGVLAAYFLPAVLLQLGSRGELVEPGRAEFWSVVDGVFLSKWIVYAGLVLFLVLFLYAAAESIVLRAWLGSLHALAHILLLGTLVTVTAYVLDLVAGWGLWDEGRFLEFLRDGVIQGDITIALIAAAAGMVPGAFVVGWYLVLCDLRYGEKLDRHLTELFASQAITEYKNFLRLHLGPDGRLTIYPIAVDKLPDGFDLKTTGTPEQPWFEPRGLAYRLLEEKPIVVAGPTRSEV